jgi:hypothetical protein
MMYQSAKLAKAIKSWRAPLVAGRAFRSNLFVASHKKYFRCNPSRDFSVKYFFLKIS